MSRLILQASMRRVLLLLFAGACSSSPGTARPVEDRCLTDGEAAACVAVTELYFDGRNHHPLDHARSFRFALAACEKGHPFGCSLLGYQYQDGLGTEWAPLEAVDAYEKACAGGAGVGCFNLASMYFGGHGVDADNGKAEALIKQARAHWERACRGDEPRWCTNLAYLLGQEGGSEEEILALNQRTCDAGFKVGCSQVVRGKQNLGKLTGDQEVAELEVLCREGEPGSCVVAGSILITGGEGVKRDVSRGLALVVRGCDIGDKEGCELAGMEYARGQLVARDQAAATRYLEAACDRGLARACMAVASQRYEGGDKPAAADYARRGCQMGNAEACAGLSTVYLTGDGVAKSEADGEKWAHVSCQMGHAPACTVLHQRGRELPVPLDVKKKMYGELCQAGDQAGCERLESLN
jgi:TPR repeat protein